MGMSVFKGKKTGERERQEGKDRKLQNEVRGISLVIQEVMYKKKKKRRDRCS